MGIDGDKCEYNRAERILSLPGGSVNITAFDEVELLNAVGTVGPVTIAF